MRGFSTAPQDSRDVAIPMPQVEVIQSSFRDLFAFTRRHHVPVMGCAFFTAALVAGARTTYAVLTGKIFDVVTRFGAGLLSPEQFMSELSKWAGYMCLLGLGMWAVSSIDMSLWVLTGELRARTARERIFTSFLHKSMAWYDSRDSGMSSLMVGIQTWAPLLCS